MASYPFTVNVCDIRPKCESNTKECRAVTFFTDCFLSELFITIFNAYLLKMGIVLV